MPRTSRRLEPVHRIRHPPHDPGGHRRLEPSTCPRVSRTSTRPRALLQAAERAAREGPHQYALTWGAANYRAALARKQIAGSAAWPSIPDEHIVVTCGSTEAMMVAMMTACDPGDRVIVFSPFYENYVADAILSGAEPIYVPLRPPDFAFDPESWSAPSPGGPRRSSCATRPTPPARCSPGRSCCSSPALAQEHDAFVITDEVYEHILYAPHRHAYFAALPGMFERTLTCSSLSKTYSITGWRLGYLIAAPGIIAAARKVHDFLTVGAAAPLQEAAVTALELPGQLLRGAPGPVRAKARHLPGLPGPRRACATPGPTAPTT